MISAATSAAISANRLCPESVGWAVPTTTCNDVVGTAHRTRCGPSHLSGQSRNNQRPGRVADSCLLLALWGLRLISLSGAVSYLLPIRREFEMGTILVVVAMRALFSGCEWRALFGLLDVGLRGSVATFAADRHAIGALRPRLKSA